MARERPVAVLVMAILNLVFGGMALAGFLCGGAFMILGFTLLSNVKGPGGKSAADDVFEVFTAIDDQVPGYLVFLAGSMILATVMAIVLVVAGIGLLKMRPWARTACIFYSVVTLGTNVASMVYQFALVNPAMEQWQRTKGAGPGNPFVGSGFNNAMSGIGSAVGLVYPTALLIVMFLPQVRAAFGPERRLPEDDSEEDVGQDDPRFQGRPD